MGGWVAVVPGRSFERSEEAPVGHSQLASGIICCPDFPIQPACPPNTSSSNRRTCAYA